MRTTLFLLLCTLGFASGQARKKVEAVTERTLWANTLYRMAEPVLRPMSEGKLQQTMKLELSPSWDKRDPRVGYMECFGRLMSGLAPWLALPDDNTPEGRQRLQLRQWALKSCARAVDSTDSDYLLWEKGNQALVDAAFLAQGFLRAYDALWVPLDSVTKVRYIELFRSLRRVNPPYNNWLLFSAVVETFLDKAGGEGDRFRITTAFHKMEEWYIGDGWYSDGPHFAFDYYNSFVIQPMYVEALELAAARKMVAVSSYDRALKRMQRYAVILERLISPEGTFPVFGRSITYRSAVLQPLALLALKGHLPKSLSNGQTRAALTAVVHRMFIDNRNFNDQGYLTLGFNGRQPNLGDYYINNGSLYLASVGFLALGLPADHPFWTDKPEPWTSQKAWNGDDFPKDHSEE